MRALIAVALAAALSMGCATNRVTSTAPDGTVTEIPEDLYAQQQQQAATANMLKSFSFAFQPANAELSEVGEVADSFRKAMAMAMMPQIARSLDNDGYWAHQNAELQFWNNILAGPATALLTPFANRAAYGKTHGAYGGSGGGYTEVNLGNRTASNNGSSNGGSGPAGAGGSASASGDNNFEGMSFSFGNKSPVNSGDNGQFVTGKDAQLQEGDGTQGQLITRPGNFPSFDNRDGSFDNNSEGAGVDTGIGAP